MGVRNDGRHMLAFLLTLLLAVALPMGAWADDDKPATSADAAADASVRQEEEAEATLDSGEVPVGQGSSEQLLSAPDGFEPGYGDAAPNVVESGLDDEGPDGSPTSDDSPQPQLVADGSYLIRPDLGFKYVLDVAGGQAVPKANVLLAQYTGGSKQAWNLTYDAGRGLYQIWRQAPDGARAVLEVQSAATGDGTNVRLWSDNHTDAQYWDIEKSGAGYRIVSALRADYALDLAQASARQDNNAQMGTAADKKTQRFFLHTTTPGIPVGEMAVEEGSYQIVSALPGGEGNVADIANGSLANNANVRMWRNNRSSAQRFYLAYHEEGYYEIASVASGHMLDAASGGLLPGTNVQQHTRNGSAAQQWVIVGNANGTYRFVNRANGLVLDISGGSAQSGANLQLYTSNGSAAQQFRLVPIDMLEEGIVNIKARADQGKVLDISGGAAIDGTGVQLWNSNNSLAQKFQLERVGFNEYRIRTGASGGWLQSGALGSQVTQEGDHASAPTPSNTWRSECIGGKVVLVNKACGGALTLSSGSYDKGTRLVTEAKTGAASQQFVFVRCDLVNAGCYFIRNGKGPYLDVAGDSTSAGANIQVWAQDKSGGQYFYLEKSGSAWKIKNAHSGKYLTAAGTGERANVAQQNSSAHDDQKWYAAIADDGCVSFVNAASGRVLDVAGGSSNNGANVQVYHANQTAAQSWKLIKTTYQPYTGYMLRAVNTANARGSSTPYLIVVDKTNHKTIVMKGGNGNWKPYRTMTCTVGAKATPTVEGTFSVGSRGYSFGSGYTCYYWTQFYNDYLFHSVLYKEGTRTIQDGRLGYHLSHGCVRLDINDAYWIYSTIPSGTRVIVYS